MGANNFLPNFNALSIPNNPLNGNNNPMNGNLYGHGIGPDSVNINLDNNFGMNKGPNMNGNLN